MHAIYIVSFYNVHDYCCCVVLSAFEGGIEPPVVALFEFYYQPGFFSYDGAVCYFAAYGVVCAVGIEPYVQLEPAIVCGFCPELQGIVVGVGGFTLGAGEVV